MRICHICCSFPPLIGGTETHNYSIVKYLSKQGYDVDVIVIIDKIELLKKTGYSKNIIDEVHKKEYSLPELENVRIYSIPCPKPLIGYYQIWKKVKDIEKKHGKFDVLDVHAYPSAIPFSKKRKIILSLHSFELTCPHPIRPIPCNSSLKNCSKCVGYFRYFYWKITKNLALEKISKIMIKYNFLIEKLIEDGIDENKLVLVPHWIVADKFNQGNKKKTSNPIKNIQANDFVFGVLGRLDAFKGVANILKAFHLLTTKYNNIKLLFIGGGELKDELMNYSVINNINNQVIFTGYVDHDDLSKYVSTVNVFIHASTYDNYNWSLLETMYFKKSIIATNVGGTKEILTDEYNSLLAEPTIHSLTQKMKMILDNPEFAKKIAENAYATVKEKHSMKNLEKYEKLLRDV
jgi:glycosyltransferase involved in cell wall biosynthesis